MLRERLKSSAILILIVNLIFITSVLWFDNETNSVGTSIVRYVRTLPVVEYFFPIKPSYSISKENLSRPRKFLINDGSLWMAYYNTDIGFSPIEQRTRKIITGFLEGDVTAVKQVDNSIWEAGLESLSIYVEYPVSFSMDMFCRIMGVDTSHVPTQINAFSDLIILPSSEETGICILIRSSDDENSIFAFMLKDDYALPPEDLSVYTTNDGYYEPAFSTGLLNMEGNVSLSPLVLFSDSQPNTEVLSPENLITQSSGDSLLNNFSFNPVTVNTYEDVEGASNYIANYGSVKIYPDSVFEYSAIEENKGILLDESGDAYNVLNASIDFAEKTWGCVSQTPLSILVTSDLSGYSSEQPYTFRFDYYCNGRPVEIELPSRFGHAKMNCAIEMTVSGGRLISYRQYMRSYTTDSYHILSDTFVTALDNFVNILSTQEENTTTIEDIYIGYLDSGNDALINAAWLARTTDNRIFRYTPEAEVTELELE